MSESHQHLSKHLEVAMRTMAASLETFTPTQDQELPKGPLTLSLEAADGTNISMGIYLCPDPTDPTGKKVIISYKPCP